MSILNGCKVLAGGGFVSGNVQEKADGSIELDVQLQSGGGQNTSSRSIYNQAEIKEVAGFLNDMATALLKIADSHEFPEPSNKKS